MNQNTNNLFSLLIEYKQTIHLCVYSCIVDKPGPPDSPTISDVHKTGCTVAWQPPKEDGGTPVTGYHIERHLTSSDRWLKVNSGAVTELTYKVNDLVEGSEYEFRVSAENKVGVGPPSSPSKPFVAKDPFSECLLLYGLQL